MLHVDDVEKACEWYSRLLERAPEYLLDDYPVLRVGDVEICFHSADSKVSSGRAGTVTYWRVADFRAAVGRAIELGGLIHRGPLAIGDGNTICQIADPFGNLFGMIGPSRREPS